MNHQIGKVNCHESFRYRCGLRIGADGYGQHDDLVVALALAVWRARKGW